jgi:hypothetical protein
VPLVEVRGEGWSLNRHFHFSRGTIVDRSLTLLEQAHMNPCFSLSCVRHSLPSGQKKALNGFPIQRQEAAPFTVAVTNEMVNTGSIPRRLLSPHP